MAPATANDNNNLVANLAALVTWSLHTLLLTTSPMLNVKTEGVMGTVGTPAACAGVPPGDGDQPLGACCSPCGAGLTAKRGMYWACARGRASRAARTTNGSRGWPILGICAGWEALKLSRNAMPRRGAGSDG